MSVFEAPDWDIDASAKRLSKKFGEKHSKYTANAIKKKNSVSAQRTSVNGNTGENEKNVILQKGNQKVQKSKEKQKQNRKQILPTKFQKDFKEKTLNIKEKWKLKQTKRNEKGNKKFKNITVKRAHQLGPVSKDIHKLTNSKKSQNNLKKMHSNCVSEMNEVNIRKRKYSDTENLNNFDVKRRKLQGIVNPLREEKTNVDITAKKSKKLEDLAESKKKNKRKMDTIKKLCRSKSKSNIQGTGKEGNTNNTQGKALKSSKNILCNEDTNKNINHKSVTSITSSQHLKLSSKLQNYLLQRNITLPILSKRATAKLCLRDQMLNQLTSSRFRYINEQMYLSEGKDAQHYFKEDPEAFKTYHDGYQKQVSQWPINPVAKIIKAIQRKPKRLVVADFGCGDALLARSVSNPVHSFDFIALSDEVTECDMAHTPLENASVDIAVFCLSLMCTDMNKYVIEANRVLKIGGLLKIAEVESRFENIDIFIKNFQKFGFLLLQKDLSHNLFYFMDFKKISDIQKVKLLPCLSLKPCLYKRR